jgi:predicted Zn-dependent peptidase
LVTSELRSRETALGKSQTLGEAAVMLGDPNRVNTDLQKLLAINADDIQRVAKKYFTDNNRYVFYYLPESERPKSAGTNTLSVDAKGGHIR